VESSGPEREFADPTGRTFLAQERTLLAWRTAFAAIGVALAVGRLRPEIAHLPKVPFLIMGVGRGILAVGLVAFGLVGQWAGEVPRRSVFEALDHELDGMAGTVG
jgi:uncharacterized membrane protein YidH (DUF202 family)